MKSIFFFFIVSFITFNQAFSQDTLYVFKGGSVLYKRAVNSIDSVGFTYIAPETMTDNEGNVYRCKKIGTQVWMTENLRTTKYRNGESIENVSDQSSWRNSKAGSWCYYDNNPINDSKYGKLYNFYAVVDSRNIAPPGWHVPTHDEWKVLKDYTAAHLAYSPNNAKALASKTDWFIFHQVADGISMSYIDNVGWDLSLNNSSGFNGLPAGIRDDGGTFVNQTTFALWWSSSLTSYINSLTNYEEIYGSGWGLLDNLDYVYQRLWIESYGFSVRLVKD